MSRDDGSSIITHLCYNVNMSIYRRNPRRDVNETEIRNAFRDLGADVRCISGEGVPDLVVGLHGKNYLVEVKTETGKLTPKQEKFHDSWLGQVAIVRSVDEAVKFVYNIKTS